MTTIYRVRLKEPQVESNGDVIPAETYSAFKLTRLGRTYYVIPFTDGQLAVEARDVEVVGKRS